MISEPFISYFRYLGVAQFSRFRFRRRCKYQYEHGLESDKQMCFTKHGYLGHPRAPCLISPLDNGRRTMPGKIYETQNTTRGHGPHLSIGIKVSYGTFPHGILGAIFQPYWLRAVSVGEIPWGSPVGVVCDFATMLLGGEGWGRFGSGHEVVNRCK